MSSASDSLPLEHPVAPITVRAHPKRAIFILGAVTAFSPVAIDMYLPAFPSIARDLHAEMGQVELTVSLFLAGMGVGQALYGPLSDRWGRRAPLLFGSMMYAIAAIGCALSNSIGLLLAGRLLMALGGAAGSVITRAIVRDWFDAKESAHVFSTLMLIMGAAPIFAPMLGSQVLLFTGWRGVFVLFALFGFACTLAVAVWLPESLPPERRNDHGFAEVFTGYWELMQNERFMAFAMAAGFASGMLFTYITGIAAVVMNIYGVRPSIFGFLFSANAFGLIAGSQINRRLLKTYSSAQIVKGVYNVTFFAAVLLFVHGLTGWGGLPVLSLLMFVLLSTMGFVFPNISALTMAPFTRQAGTASAMLGTTQYVIGCIAGGLVSLFHDGTARPLTFLMSANAVIGWVLVRRALKRA